MTSVTSDILHARPSLRKILPVIFWQTTVFTCLNFALSAGLFLWHPEVYPLVAPNQYMLTVWAVLYGAVGLALGLGLLTKHWEMLRLIMCIALFYKFLWSIALLFRITDGGTLLIATLFIGLAALQACVVIFFLPPDEGMVSGKLT